jgi:V-type H+-transporting ATPase subunit D
MQAFKQRMVGAKKGYDLLKKKSDALKKAFNDIMKVIVITKKRMGKDFHQCQLEMAQANFAAGDFSVNVLDSVKTKTNVRVIITTENVAGVHQPTFHLRGMNEDEDSTIGIIQGGQAIMKAKDRFQKYLRLLVEVATYQT